MLEIKITVPMDVTTLVHTAAMLTVLAETIDDNVVFATDAITTSDKREDETPGQAGVVTGPSLEPAGAAILDASNEQDTAETKEQTITRFAAMGVDLDDDLLPWDERIHGEKKLKTKKDNLWKKRRNIDPALVARVETELRATMVAGIAPPPAETGIAPPPAETGIAPPPPAATSAAPPPPPATATVETVTKYITPDGGEYTMAEMLESGWSEEQILERESVEVPIAPVTRIQGLTFPQLMAKITPAIATGSLTDDMVNAAVGRQGLAELFLLSTRPDLVPAVDAELFPVA